MEDIFDNLINRAGGVNNGFIFLCSYDFKNELSEYKGIKVVYCKLLQKETIIYLPSPFIN